MKVIYCKFKAVCCCYS